MLIWRYVRLLHRTIRVKPQDQSNHLIKVIQTITDYLLIFF
jgi:hypothetical protein